MFRESYERKVSGNYMLLEEEETASDRNEFEIRMLTENSILGLLPCVLRHMDGREQFAYDITSKQSLARLYEQRDIGYQDMKCVISGIIRALASMTEFFLQEDNLIFLPEQIYLDIETKQTFLCFYPFYHTDIGKSLQQFAEYLLQKTEHADEKAVVLAYAFYKQIANEDYCLKKLLTETEERKEPVQRKTEVYQKEIYQRELEIEKEEQLSQNQALTQMQEIKAEQKERWTFAICTGILLVLIGLVLYLEIYEPLLITAWLSYEIITVIIAVIGAVSVFFFCTMFCRQYRKRKKRLLQLKEQNNVKKKTLKEQEEAGFQDYCGETACLKEEGIQKTHRLIQLDGEKIREIRITKSPFIIGKKKTLADGVLMNPAVSRMHAKIYCEGEDCFLEDLNSTNGTSRNGVRLNANEHVMLSYNDEIDFAGEIFYFR